MAGRGFEELADDAGALTVETEMPAQIGVDPVIGQGTQQDNEWEDGQQQRGAEKDDRVGEVEGAEPPEEDLGRRAFEAAPSTEQDPHGETK
jgi:hypothetical protein